MKTVSTLFVIVLIGTSNTIAQDLKMYEQQEFRKAVKHETRTRDGRPGVNYWQNFSDYTLDVSIDPSENILTGQATIKYHNNSPVTLKDLHIRLYQDLYKQGTVRNFPVSDEDIHDGTFIDSLSIDNTQYILHNEPVNQNIVNRFSTDLTIQLSDSIPSGSSCKIEIAWNFNIPSSYSFRRLGRYRDDFFMAQWYPQIAVYDDIRGWDNIPHYGIQEFYNDFNNYDVTIDLPEGYMIWATGECENLPDVLSESVINRLNLAKSQDSMVSIISSEDYQNNPFKGNSWHFIAKHVPDFAFAAATNYLWKGTSIKVDQQSDKRVLIDIVYPEESDHYSNSLQVAKDAITWTSFTFPGIPYPYSHATSFFNGTDLPISMEFPMIANDATFPDINKHYATVAHEVFHNYMPFYLGFNETIFGWMDEGWVTFLENKFTGDKFSIYEVILSDYPHIAGSIYDRPLFFSGMDLNIYNRMFLGYLKPAINLMLLEELMGEEIFLKATKDFINIWKGKHPSPYDFFHTYNKYTEKDINWFWNACYFEHGYADLGIKSVNSNKILIENKGNMPVSVKLEISYDDHSTEKIYKNLSIWESGVIEYPVDLKTNKKIRKVILGDKLIPDNDLTNNIYHR